MNDSSGKLDAHDINHSEAHWGNFSRLLTLSVHAEIYCQLDQRLFSFHPLVQMLGG